MACVFLDRTRTVNEHTCCHCSWCQVLEQRIETTQIAGIEPERLRVNMISFDAMDKELGVGTWEMS